MKDCLTSKCSNKLLCCQNIRKDETDSGRVHSELDNVDSPRIGTVTSDESNYKLAQKLIQMLEEKDIRRTHSTGQRNFKDGKDIEAGIK